MQSLRRHRNVAVLCAALQLVLSFALTADLVLCQSAAGHVEVESAFSADCCTDHALPAGIRGAEADDACGCIDTPLWRTPLDGRPKVTASISTRSAALVAVLPARAGIHQGWTARRTGGSSGPARAGDALVARRSVVLVV